MGIGNFLDYTLLKPNTTVQDITNLCREAEKHELKAVCIPPYYVEFASKQLTGAKPLVCTVVGFPMGYSSIASKVEEIRRAIDQGVSEIDAMINVSAVKSQDWNYVKNEIESLTTAVHLKGKVIKLIFETGLLTKEEIKKLCNYAKENSVDFVKNSTGFHAEGASVATVQFLRENLPNSIKIKAAGGIRSAEFARQLLEAGANRLGSSTCLQLL